ncbi:MAG: TIGR02757 family protein [Bacteroidota bacterium]|nr:TIGR02757 family protein [Bacteroidota bacterium]
MSKTELMEFLEEKVLQFETPDFIPLDPISIPHMFSDKKDVEIAGFLAATIAWGKRSMILKNAHSLMERMDHSPYDFIVNFEDCDSRAFDGFVHRTFQQEDVICFIKALQRLIKNYGSIESIFSSHWIESGRPNNLKNTIANFHSVFFDQPHAPRSRKHLANPAKGSAAKRINMYLRWMVRSSEKGVDLGIWKEIPSSVLSIPIDVHTSNVGRQLGLLCRKQNDWKAVAEYDEELRKMDPSDPVKYDFALFSLGAIQGF